MNEPHELRPGTELVSSCYLGLIAIRFNWLRFLAEQRKLPGIGLRKYWEPDGSRRTAGMSFALIERYWV